MMDTRKHVKNRTTLNHFASGCPEPAAALTTGLLPIREGASPAWALPPPLLGFPDQRLSCRHRPRNPRGLSACSRALAYPQLKSILTTNTNPTGRRGTSLELDFTPGKGHRPRRRQASQVASTQALRPLPEAPTLTRLCLTRKRGRESHPLAHTSIESAILRWDPHPRPNRCHTHTSTP